MSDGPLPNIGTEWRHAFEPGIYVITDATTDGRVIWTEKDAAGAPEWVAPVGEFLEVFTRVPEAS